MPQEQSSASGSNLCHPILLSTAAAQCNSFQYVMMAVVKEELPEDTTKPKRKHYPVTKVKAKEYLDKTQSKHGSLCLHPSVSLTVPFLLQASFSEFILHSFMLSDIFLALGMRRIGRASGCGSPLNSAPFLRTPSQFQRNTKRCKHM